jgi:CubicO group peptidase (beta-lactamase class C family)
MKLLPIETIRKQLDKNINKHLKNNTFSGCSIGYFKFYKTKVERSFHHYGKIGFQTGDVKVDNASVFDLASLTKPIVISLCILALLEEEKLKLDLKLGEIFDFSDETKKNITLSDLLNHRSGLPSHREYYKKLVKIPAVERHTWVLNRILDEKLLYFPGEAAVYSDLGYILLGRVIEKISGIDLNSYWKKVVVYPLELQNSLFFRDLDKIGVKPHKSFIATGRCNWSGRELRGVVHDDNCRSLGGVAGHAGLFGTLEALLSFCEYLVKIYNGFDSHPIISTASFKSNIDNKVGERRFGFDVPSGEISSSGAYFSKKSIGHLGFTGTSFWLDLEQNIGVVLLTNRVYCGENLKSIQELRPAIHDIIMKNIKAG